ncbi:MAG: hypothetical protein JSV43_07780 [Methanobacteriota archaeon]|nr:MAG: hypothetical protein JSV43_07780 [Euryarchaeota archaeon]
MPVVTMEELKEAMRKTLGRKGLSEKEIASLAEYLLSFFGFGEEVVDNRLDVEDRDVFYMLEEEGLLTTRQEEIHLKRGKLWRIHYWVLRTAHIKELAHAEEDESEIDHQLLYSSISEEVWSRNL